MKHYWLPRRLPSVATSKITRRFTLYIISFSLLVALVISALTIYKNYHDDLSRIHKDLMQIERSVKSSLVHNLWQMDLDALEILTNDLFREKDIAYVGLFDEKENSLIVRGAKPKENAMERSISLYYHPDNGERVYLGRLDYIATTTHLYERHRESVFRAIVPIVIFFLFLSLIIVLLYWHSTIKYLLVIKEYTEKLRLGGYKDDTIDDLMLNRPAENSNEKDELGELISTINDMRHEIIEKYTAIQHQSLHDALTGLPNMRMINSLIKDAIVRCQTTNKYGALFYIDPDQLKLVSDSLGHATRDRVLLEISNRLTAVCGKNYQPAKIAGNEFLVLQNKMLSSREDAKTTALAFAKEILSLISEKIIIGNNSIKITVSIGIALFGAESETETIIKQADNALYHGKEKGRNQITLFTPSMQEMTDKRLWLEQLISVATEEELLFVNYQPKYDAQHKIYSAEALVRMHDMNGDTVSPGEFIPLAEESGQIIQIGDHIIEIIFGFIQKNQSDIARSGLKSIAINISPIQYSAPGFVERIIAYAKQYKVDPDFIILEITEDVMVDNIDTVLDVMVRLKKYGFKFSIDDFGTGYSSFRYLKNLPLNELKIDKSFINDMLKDDKAAAIIKTIINMAHNLKFDIVAEGVENADQFDTLLQYGCELYQGFLFSRPLEENAFLGRLKGE